MWHLLAILAVGALWIAPMALIAYVVARIVVRRRLDRSGSAH